MRRTKQAVFRFPHTAPNAADDSSLRRERDGLKPSKMHATLLYKWSMPSLRAIDGVWMKFSLENDRREAAYGYFPMGWE